MFFNIFATILWAVLIGSTAYMMGDLVYTYIEEFKSYGIAFVAVMIIGIFLLFRKYK